MDIVYFFLRIFVKIVVRLFFRQVTVIGRENIPASGPVIICATHNNQYVDAMMLIYAIRRPINFVIAASSAKLSYMKWFSKVAGFIPTERPIDHKVTGKGILVKVTKNSVIGEGTEFTKELHVGCSIKPKDLKEEFIVSRIVSDTELAVSTANDIDTGESYDLEKPSAYFILPKLDQKKVFSSVANVIQSDQVIGIFPEGGSHDQTKLLPLKAGACVFVWSAHAELNKDPAMICTGINYYDASKFRSKVIINISKPIKYEIDPNRFTDRAYKQTKIQEMLSSMRQSMEDVKFLAPSYKELMNLNVAGQLYTPSDVMLNKEEQFRLFKKFCNGYENIKDQQDVKDLLENVEVFRQKMKSLGLIVHDVRDKETKLQIRPGHAIIQALKMLIGIPFLLFLLPIRLILSKEAEKKRQKALSSSYVKVRGTDVMTTWKIVLSMVLIPVSLTIWVIGFYFCSKYAFKSESPFFYTMIFYFIFPVYLYASVYMFDGIERSLNILYARLVNILLTKIDKKDRIKELRGQAEAIEKQLVKVIKDNIPKLHEELKELVVKRLELEKENDQTISDILDEI